MKTLEDIDTGLTDRERMELIWVKNGIKPVGEIKNADFRAKQLLNQLGFFADSYGTSLFYSKKGKYLKEIKQATDSSDFIKAGRLWGYPSCCIQYFNKLGNCCTDPYKESLEMVKDILRRGKKAYAYFLDYTPCPECISNRNSSSGKLEENLAEMLKAEDNNLYERFKRENRGEIVLLNGSEGEDILLWDYRGSE